MHLCRAATPPFVLLTLLAACAQPPADDSPLRLVDLFPQATVSGLTDVAPAAELAAPEPTVAEPTVAEPTVAEPTVGGGWQFAADDEAAAAAGATRGWQIESGVTGLAIHQERLVGRTTDEYPILRVERTAGFDHDDLLHSVELRMKVSAGTDVWLTTVDQEEPDWDRVLGRARLFPWPAKAALEPGEEVRTYILKPRFDAANSDIRHLLIRPTDVADADFEIESVRLVFRNEHLASQPASIGWHGMSNVYREGLTTRTSQVASFAVTLPAAPWLDVALASADDAPVTFRVTLRTGDGEQHTLLERTVSTPHVWQPVAVDLSAFGGRQADLALSATGEPGGLGFWGAPVIRSRAQPSDESPQGVIVILGDTLRSDHLDAWGYGRETAPVITSLAANGARAEDCISQATWTKVSVPSIFTSRYPLSHGVRTMTDRLPASAHTLAEVFRDAGYATLGLSSISFTGRMTNLHQGYEEFHESASLSTSNSKTARTYVDRLLDWIDRHRDTPFFVFLHVADPHSPYLAYPPYDTMWGEPGDSEEYLKQQDATREHIESPLMRSFGMPARQEIAAAGLDPEQYVDYELDAYDGSIRAMDLEIQRLIERLRELGLDDRTLIAFVSDHGTEFLDHDRHFHGHSVYGELNRVPMVLWGPNVAPGTVITETVQALDLMPTVIELSGLEPPAGMQGQSLASLMSGDATSGDGDRFRPRPAFTEKAFIGEAEGPLHGDLESYSIIADGWKLIHNPRRPDGRPEHQLYDHRADPLNRNDLASEHPERVEQLLAQLDAWRASAEAELLPADADLAEGMSPDDLERLRSLGYVQ